MKEITIRVLEKNNASRFFLLIDEMEGLKHKRYGVDFEEFFMQFAGDLRTLINGEGRYDVKNCITVVFCTVPNVWEEFQRKEDIAGGLITREYSEPFRLQRFSLDKALLFVKRYCQGLDNSPFSINSIRTLHIVSDGKPRLLTKLCKHVEGNLPASKRRLGEDYVLRGRLLKSLCEIVGEDVQVTYAFDTNAYQALSEEIERQLSQAHKTVFSLFVGEYGEYSEEDIAELLKLEITDVRRILSDLSDDETSIHGIRPLSKGQMYP